MAAERPSHAPKTAHVIIFCEGKSAACQLKSLAPTATVVALNGVPSLDSNKTRAKAILDTLRSPLPRGADRMIVGLFFDPDADGGHFCALVVALLTRHAPATFAPPHMVVIPLLPVAYGVVRTAGGTPGDIRTFRCVEELHAAIATREVLPLEANQPLPLYKGVASIPSEFLLAALGDLTGSSIRLAPPTSDDNRAVANFFGTTTADVGWRSEWTSALLGNPAGARETPLEAGEHRVCSVLETLMARYARASVTRSLPHASTGVCRSHHLALGALASVRTSIALSDLATQMVAKGYASGIQSAEAAVIGALSATVHAGLVNAHASLPAQMHGRAAKPCVEELVERAGSAANAVVWHGGAPASVLAARGDQAAITMSARYTRLVPSSFLRALYTSDSSLPVVPLLFCGGQVVGFGVNSSRLARSISSVVAACRALTEGRPATDAASLLEFQNRNVLQAPNGTISVYGEAEFEGDDARSVVVSTLPYGMNKVAYTRRLNAAVLRDSSRVESFEHRFSDLGDRVVDYFVVTLREQRETDNASEVPERLRAAEAALLSCTVSESNSRFILNDGTVRVLRPDEVLASHADARVSDLVGSLRSGADHVAAACAAASFILLLHTSPRRVQQRIRDGGVAGVLVRLGLAEPDSDVALHAALLLSSKLGLPSYARIAVAARLLSSARDGLESLECTIAAYSSAMKQLLLEVTASKIAELEEKLDESDDNEAVVCEWENRACDTLTAEVDVVRTAYKAFVDADALRKHAMRTWARELAALDAAILAEQLESASLE